MRVLLTASGSISAYKAYDLCRELFKNGHQIKVILTRGALKFIRPETFHYLGASAVFTHDSDFDLNHYGENNRVLHIDLAKWADKLITFPMSANTLSNLARGAANDLLSSTFLAFAKDKPILLFPAMNPNMLSHSFVIENMQKLQRLPNVFIHPTGSGEMVCGDEGEGKLADIFQVRDFVESFTLKMSGKKIVITTGATRSPLDPVRYLTNPSSGLTGYEFAKYYLAQGHSVSLIAGIGATDSLERLITHPNFVLSRVETTQEMYQKVLEEVQDAQLFIASAAVSDIVFEKEKHKLKKDQIQNTLSFNLGEDILKAVLELKKENLKTVGFAAETNLSEETLKEKWAKKPTDLLIGNLVSNAKEPKGFNSLESEFTFFEKNQISHKAVLNKKELASLIEKKVNF